MARGRRRHHRGRRKPGNWFTRLSIGKRIAVCMGGLILALGITGVAYAASKLNKLDTEEIPAEDIVVNKQAEEAGEGYTNVAHFGIDSRSGNSRPKKCSGSDLKRQYPLGEVAKAPRRAA